MSEATAGRIEWIGVRSPRQKGVGSQAPTVSGPMIARSDAVVDETGLADDRNRKSGAKRSVTLIQAEHLPVISSLLGGHDVTPAATRRNLVVSGINLQRLKRATFLVGEVVLEGTGDCHPCSKMDTTLRPGGHDAMRGHGGITARVIRGGRIRIGDEVALAADSSSD